MPLYLSSVTPTAPSFGSTLYGTPVTLSAIYKDVEYSLDDGTFCYWVGDDGLGLAPLHRLSERGPLQHGDTDRGYRLDPRTIRLVLDIVATSQDAFEHARLSLLHIFKPNTSPIKLKFAMVNGTYYMDCYTMGAIPMPSVDRMAWNQTVVIELKANDPTFYDPELNVHTYTVVGGADTGEIPMPVPSFVGIGSSSVSITENIVNEGTADVFPQIHLSGPLEDPVITNNSTGETLSFNGTHIAAAHYYNIDCRYGYKTIIDNHDVNQIAALTDDSDLVSFHLGTDPDVVDGANSITVTAGGMDNDSRIVMYYYTRYVGI